MLGNLSSINHSKFGIINFLLLPLSLVFYTVSRIHFWLYKSSILKVKKSNVPVVVVGNITAGGTGKTPIVISIVNYFESRNKKVGVVSRGYGGNYSASAVGEVNVVAEMKAVQAVIGGEGNGGVIYPELHYGRDAVVGVALFLSLLVDRNQTAAQIRAT